RRPGLVECQASTFAIGSRFSEGRRKGTLQLLWSNTYQASVVKRADGCIARGGGPPHGRQMKRQLRAACADLISVAGPSRRLHQTPIEARCDQWITDSD